MSHVHTAGSELDAVEIHGITRSSFILRGAVAAGSVYGAGMVGPFVRQALAQGGGGDVDVISLALTLEFLEAAFYKEAAKIKDLSDGCIKAVETFGNEEQPHVDPISNATSE